jgi:hypothetical protein
MRSRLVGPLCCAALGAASSALLLRRGVVMGPDSWAYWEGSVSLLERGHYTYLGGAPILAFPPLFSVILALVQAVLGVSMRSLAIAVCALVGVGSFLWMWLYGSVKTEPGASPADALAVPTIAATLAVSAQTLLSESLWLAILPALLLLLLAPADGREPQRLLASALLLAALLLTRNATVALLPAAVLLLWRRRPEWSRRRRLGVVAAVMASALVPWLAVRAWLGQVEAHAPGRGAHDVLAYSRQAVDGLASGLGPERWGIGIALLAATALTLAWEVTRPAGRSQGVGLALFAVLGLAGHVLLFALTYVAEPIRGRFVVFAVLALSVAVLTLARRRPVLLTLGAMLAAVPLYRVAVKARLAGIEQPTVALCARISSDYPSGPPRPAGAGVLIAPPTYPWIPHR